MALCFIMMCGRLGTVAGGNIFGALLENHCDTFLYLCFGLLIGSYDLLDHRCSIFIIFYCFFSVNFYYVHRNTQNRKNTFVE